MGWARNGRKEVGRGVSSEGSPRATIRCKTGQFKLNWRGCKSGGRGRISQSPKQKTKNNAKTHRKTVENSRKEQATNRVEKYEMPRTFESKCMQEKIQTQQNPGKHVLKACTSAAVVSARRLHSTVGSSRTSSSARMKVKNSSGHACRQRLMCRHQTRHLPTSEPQQQLLSFDRPAGG